MAQNPGERRHDEQVVPGAHPSGRPGPGPGDARERHAGEAKGGRDASGSSVGVTNLVITGALALIFGLLGAWAYDAFLAGALEAGKDQAAEGQTSSGQVAATESGERGLPAGEHPVEEASADRIDQLAEEVARLRETVESSAGPAPTSRAEELDSRLAKVEDRLAATEAIARDIEGLSQQLQQRSARLEAMADLIDEMESRLTALSDRVGAPGGPADAGRSEASRQVLGPAPDAGSADATLERGIGRFKADDFEAARGAFLGLLEQEPSDARVWYYAALANGKATGEWQGETERLVLRGVDRERAGTPPKAAIDATFSDLTERQGSEWLAYYRRRAGG